MSKGIAVMELATVSEAVGASPGWEAPRSLRAGRSRGLAGTTEGMRAGNSACPRQAADTRPLMAVGRGLSDWIKREGRDPRCPTLCCACARREGFRWKLNQR